jgi:TnpA family transposase
VLARDFTDHVFALCHLLGFRFAPRIRDLADKRLYVPGKAAQWPALGALIGGSIQNKLIEQQFAEALRLAASIRHLVVAAITLWNAPSLCLGNPRPSIRPCSNTSRRSAGSTSA